MTGDPKNYIHDYESAGFNGFFRRTIAGNNEVTTLGGMSNSRQQRQLNFDNEQISGALGDTLRIGRIFLDGKIGRQSIVDERNNEMIRLGDTGLEQ